MDRFNVTSSTSTIHEGLDISNNGTVVEPAERPEWLMILDHISTILMTCNTVTLMLAMGAATYWKEIWHHVKRPWGSLLGMLCQFALLPAVGFGLCVSFQLSPYESLGVLILACSPGGAFSNFFTYWVEGDLALSILMTAVSSLLALGMMPLNLWVYTKRWTDHELQVPYINVLISLAFVTVPVIVGMVIRHFNRKWASYISKVCGLLGWVGAVSCGVMLILIYWDIIIDTSLYLIITAALVPIAGVIVAYVMAIIVCFSHRMCRTIAIETGCQNMVVATNVMLLSFTDPVIRGQMVIFPVLYGLCQLAEVLVAVGVYQLWKYCYQDNVVEEGVESVVDNTILASVPVPAHRLSQATLQKMTGFSGTPDICRLQKQSEQQQREIEFSTYSSFSGPSSSRVCNDESMGGEMTPFLGNRSPPPPKHIDEVDDPDTWVRSPTKLPEVQTTVQPEKDVASPFPFYGRPKSPIIFNFPQSPYFDTTTPTLPLDCDRDDVGIFDQSYQYDTESQKSPTLSNKGVPNMFPVTEDDFRPSREPSRESSPLPYGSPISPLRERVPEIDWSCSSCPTSPILSPGPSQTFGFYHNDVRIGQAEHLSSFGRKNSKRGGSGV